MTNPINPYDLWRSERGLSFDNFAKSKTSFVHYLPPQIAVQLTTYQVLSLLKNRLGNDLFYRAINPNNTVESPITNSDWLKTSNMVGVNIRTIGSFSKLLNYALTLPASIDSIHILPIWEPGVVSSLYGKVSWNINPEFYDHKLQEALKHLNTVENQLKVVVNLLHALGKKVGLDVIPHTDRFSEMVFIRPRFFEWVKRDEEKIEEFSDQLSNEVENKIWEWLNLNLPANDYKIVFSKEDFFDKGLDIEGEKLRAEILFGRSYEYTKRQERRISLMQYLVANKLETLPVTMAPPYRGLKISSNFEVDSLGIKWNEFEFIKPQVHSRVFGPLTRYKLYFLKGETQELDFTKPNKEAWNYLKRNYAQQQKLYNFDFMRGDMAHVQMRPEGVPKKISSYYDPLKEIKKHIKKTVPYFGFFAETFLVPPNTFAYGVEEDHLEAIDADSTLGDLQSSVVGSPEFKNKLLAIQQLNETKSFAPNFTQITADKDDPRFDKFYKKGNVFRFFVGLFLSRWPSYYSLGFTQRNLHKTRGKNEEYSKLYVFQIDDPEKKDKVTCGPFVWGENYAQFLEMEKIKIISEQIPFNEPFKWIQKSDKNELIWTIGDYLFIASIGSTSSYDFSKHKESELLYKYTPEHPLRIYRV